MPPEGQSICLNRRRQVDISESRQPQPTPSADRWPQSKSRGQLPRLIGLHVVLLTRRNEATQSTESAGKWENTCVCVYRAAVPTETCLDTATFNRVDENAVEYVAGVMGPWQRSPGRHSQILMGLFNKYRLGIRTSLGIENTLKGE
ncbi:unnamed protein product [Protopolystoma xenopodis]|uniref:Uncharacterized protein n=1 Tax=Protopolystoma xenopodis TaxID=117903 RepID=A0A3S5AJK2_9PLAT|nr:unnamed protein product [Protopolystoma xenopodis]